MSLEFLIRSDTNQAAQPQKMARGLKFRRDCTVYVVKQRPWFSHNVTQMA